MFELDPVDLIANALAGLLYFGLLTVFDLRWRKRTPADHARIDKRLGTTAEELEREAEEIREEAAILRADEAEQDEITARKGKKHHA